MRTSLYLVITTVSLITHTFGRSTLYTATGHDRRDGLQRLDGRSTTNATSSASIPLPPSTTPNAPPSPTPTPMDLFLSYSISNACVGYITSVITSSEFQSCLAFSLLLKTSTSYASLVKSSITSGDYSTLNELLAYVSSPHPSSSECDSYFQGIYQDVGSKGHCGPDISKGEPVALEFQGGVGNYQVMREAAALKDNSTGKYCYLEALSSASSDIYLWSLPSGTPLPASAKPTCSSCSSQLLSHYGSYITLPTMNGTIIEAAIDTANQVCGGTMASYTATTTTGSGARIRIPSIVLFLSVIGTLWTAM